MDCNCNIKIVSHTEGCGYLDVVENGKKRRLFPLFRVYPSETDVISVYAADNEVLSIPSSCEVTLDGVTYDEFAELEAKLLEVTCALNDINVNAVIDKTGLATEANQEVLIAQIKGNTSALTQVPSTAAVVELVAANPNRIRVTINNDSDENLYVIEGAGGSISAFSHKLQKRNTDGVGGEISIADYTGAIYGVWDAANGQAAITEITNV
jgi:hypothetical protein